MSPEGSPDGSPAGWHVRADRENTARPVPPMLPVAGPMPTDGDAFGYEFKWDGVRAGALVRGGVLRLISRNQRDITAAYPELAVLGDATDGRQVVLDGEIVAFDAAGRPSFEVLQRRMHVREPTRRLVTATPVWYCVFDVVHLDGWSTRRMSYADRRGLLEGLDLSAPGVEVPPSFVGGGDDVLQVSAERGLEGVLAKRLDSTYRPGQRSNLWVKVKLTRDQEVVIGGWKPGEGRRSGTLGSLLLGVPGPGGLRYAGHVGTGFTEAALRDLMDRLRRLERGTSPFTGQVPAEHARRARWVQPRIVGEVRFTEWTRDGVLRHPSWRGLRPDKSPADVVPPLPAWCRPVRRRHRHPDKWFRTRAARHSPGSEGDTVRYRRRAARVPNNSVATEAACCCTPGDSRPTRERVMRRASTSIQTGTAAYREGMTLREHGEPGNSGACRRR